MRIVPSSFALLALLAFVPSSGSAGLNRNHMVPVYAPCETAETCNPPALASPYSFESAVLYSTTQQYSGPGKLALVVVVKGVKDPSGAPFTGRLTLSTGTSRVTLLKGQLVATFRDDSIITEQPPYVVEVKRGDGRLRYHTPDDTPDEGLVVNSLTSPILYDPDGKPLASTGTQTKR